MLYLLNEWRLSPESVNCCVSALKFIYLTTPEMPWTDEYFPRAKRPHKRSLPSIMRSRRAKLDREFAVASLLIFPKAGLAIAGAGYNS